MCPLGRQFMREVDRRKFLLQGAGAAGSAWLLAACGGAQKSAAVTTAPKSRPPLSAESGNLSILEWGGYEAAGTKAQTAGLLAGTDYTKKYGAGGLTYTSIINDDQALQKA